MKTISDQTFLAWAADAGLVPDPAYPDSRQQLVFTPPEDFWAVWESPRETSECSAFLERALAIVGGVNSIRVRLRGGGSFRVEAPSSERGAALQSALSLAGVHEQATGALEFDRGERPALVNLAAAFICFGYRVETDLELVPIDRSACFMLDHHGEVVVRFARPKALRDFSNAMAAAGYPRADDEQGNQ